MGDPTATWLVCAELAIEPLGDDAARLGQYGVIQAVAELARAKGWRIEVTFPSSPHQQRWVIEP